MKLLVFVCLCIVLFGLVQARGRGGGGRGRGSSRSSSRSRSGSSSGKSTRRSYKYGPYGSAAVTKYTPIPVRTSHSPVIVRQTSIPKRPNYGTRLFLGYLIVRHQLNYGPVYRERYPLYRGQVTIPEERAIRVNFTEEKMLDSNGSVCLSQNDKHSLMADYQDRIVSVTTIVRYSHETNGRVYFGDNRTLDLDKAALDKSVEVWTIIGYNGSIIENTNCTQMRSVMNGTIVRLYATNPDDAGTLRSSLSTIFLSAVLCFALYVLD